MKNIVFLFSILLLPFITNCKKEGPKPTIIDINIKNLEIDSVRYYASKNGKSLYPFLSWKKAEVDTTGHAKIEFLISEINSILIIARKDTFVQRIKLLIKPNENYFVNIDPRSERVFEIHGKDNEVQIEYSKLKRYYLTYAMEYKSDTTPELLLNTLQKEISKELEPFNNLLITKKIDKKFYSIVKTNIECYNSYKLLTMIKHRHNNAINVEYGSRTYKELNTIKNLNPEYLTLMNNVFEAYSFKKPEAWLMSEISEYLNLYVWYKMYNPEKEFILEEDYNISLLTAKEVLSAEEYEYYYASKFMMLNTDIEIIENRLVDFKKEFPESPYIYEIDKAIKQFHTVLKNGYTF